MRDRERRVGMELASGYAREDAEESKDDEMRHCDTIQYLVCCARQPDISAWLLVSRGDRRKVHRDSARSVLRGKSLFS